MTRQAPIWRPGMRIPEGFYRSVLHPTMIFRKRDDGAITLSTSVRYLSRSTIHECVTSDPYAAEGKKLSSEDAQRYGIALSIGKLSDYFKWRASVGLSWWLELEQRYPAAANDNAAGGKEVAA